VPPRSKKSWPTNIFADFGESDKQEEVEKFLADDGWRGITDRNGVKRFSVTDSSVSSADLWSGRSTSPVSGGSSSRVFGGEHPSTLTSMANLASTYRNQGRWKEAEELFVQVMEMSSRELGAEHPDTLRSMANLASTFGNQGRWKEAEELFVQVMEMSSRMLGAEHPDTLTSMANLASTFGNQGRLKEAEELFM
jgi:tetratricopeptide (TPR) repeat protein